MKFKPTTVQIHSRHENKNSRGKPRDISIFLIIFRLRGNPAGNKFQSHLKLNKPANIYRSFAGSAKHTKRWELEEGEQVLPLSWGHKDSFCASRSYQEGAFAQSAKLLIYLGLILFIFLPFSNVLALSRDHYQPYHVHAKSIIYKRKLHLTIYKGNVHASQGTSTLSGDKIIVYNSAINNNILRIVTTGHPAHYSTLPDNQRQRLYAEAKTIEYYPQQNQVLLLKKGKITQDKNVFTGPHIWYDIRNQTVISTNPKGDSQTKIVIEPQK